MTFELSSGLLAARDRARAFATSEIQPQAAAIDRTAAVPEELARGAAAAVAAGDPLSLVVTVEELAAASGTVALAAVFPAKRSAPPGLAGLRGAPAADDAPRTQLVLAAVTLGLGRAALDCALARLKELTANRGSDNEAPHWVVADVATELDGARLLNYKAAQSGASESSESDIAVARLLASGAAARAVDAALRIAGPSGYEEGSLLERLARDIRAIVMLHGTEERQRAQAAGGLLPP